MGGQGQDVGEGSSPGCWLPPRVLEFSVSFSVWTSLFADLLLTGGHLEKNLDVHYEGKGQRVERSGHDAFFPDCPLEQLNGTMKSPLTPSSGCLQL